MSNPPTLDEVTDQEAAEEAVEIDHTVKESPKYDNGGTLPAGVTRVSGRLVYGPRGPILDADQEVRTFAAEKAGTILRNAGTVFAKGEPLDVLSVIRLASWIETGVDYLDLSGSDEEDEDEVPEEPPAISTWQ